MYGMAIRSLRFLSPPVRRNINPDFPEGWFFPHHFGAVSIPRDTPRKIWAERHAQESEVLDNGCGLEVLDGALRLLTDTLLKSKDERDLIICIDSIRNPATATRREWLIAESPSAWTI